MMLLALVVSKEGRRGIVSARLTGSEEDPVWEPTQCHGTYSGQWNRTSDTELLGMKWHYAGSTFWIIELLVCSPQN